MVTLGRIKLSVKSVSIAVFGKTSTLAGEEFPAEMAKEATDETPREHGLIDNAKSHTGRRSEIRFVRVQSVAEADWTKLDYLWDAIGTNVYNIQAIIYLLSELMERRPRTKYGDVNQESRTTMVLEHENVTVQIIGAAFEVYRELGYGFPEKVYQKAMQVELIKRGLTVKLEDPIQVLYKGVEVGKYKADLFVDDCVIVELKTAKTYNSEVEPQLLNELKATRIKGGSSSTSEEPGSSLKGWSSGFRVSPVFNPWPDTE